MRPQSGEENQREEVQGHQQVVRHGGRAHHALGDVKLAGHGRKIHTAADVGAGHHRRHARQLRDVVPQQEKAQQRPQDGPRRAGEKDEEHLSGLPPDPLEAALLEEHGDAQGHGEAPDHIVVEPAADRQHAQVGQQQSQQQRQDPAGDLRCPP